MTRTLKLAADNFDQINTFTVEVGRHHVVTCSLYRNVGDGIYWGMNAGSMLKAHYTAEDRAERERLNSETPVKHGDVVVINGDTYTAKVMGAFSDAVIFEREEEAR